MNPPLVFLMTPTEYMSFNRRCSYIMLATFLPFQIKNQMDFAELPWWTRLHFYIKVWWMYLILGLVSCSMTNRMIFELHCLYCHETQRYSQIVFIVMKHRGIHKFECTLSTTQRIHVIRNTRNEWIYIFVFVRLCFYVLFNVSMLFMFFYACF